MPTPPANAKTSTFQVGTYTALTDTFSLVLDLNDGATWWISQGKLKLDQPDKVDNRSFNLRTAGERVVKTQYKNRHIQASVNLRGASTSAMLASVRALIAAIEHPDTNPYCLRLALPGATQYSYADVVRIKHNIPADPLSLLALAIPHVELDFECRPFLRGDRLTLSNLLANPGFEAPMGGGLATVAPVAFADPLANVNAYSVLAGSAPTTGPANTYVDTVLANGGANLLRYYRLDEASGTSAYDIGGTGQTGTYNGSPTLGVPGAISGDTDTAITLNGSSQFVSLPTTGLPSGSAAWSVGCWVKLSATPSAFVCMATWGTNTANQRVEMAFNSGGQPYVGFGGGAVATGSVLTNNVWHLVVGTFDGAHTLTLYVDGAQVAQNTSATGGNIVTGVAYLGQFAGATGRLAGSLDEAKIWSTALSGTAISALYAAGHSGASGTLANAMSVPNGATLGFGSSAWGAIQTWQVRFRWVEGLILDAYVHYTNANNALLVAAGGNPISGHTLSITQVIGGTSHQLASSAITPTSGGYYWLVVTQFPAPPGVPPYVQAALYYDVEGVAGSQVGGTIAGATFDAVTALAGTAAIAASGAALVLGGQGNSAGAGQQVSLFGPGGWKFHGNAGAAPASGAWDGSVAGAPTSTNTPGTNTATVGATNSGNLGLVQVPVTSFGSARIDAPPTGGWLGNWQTGDSTSLVTLQQSAMAVAAGGHVLNFTGMLRATGNGAGYSALLTVLEYDNTGAQIASTSHTIASGSASLSSWTAWSWTLTTNASTSYVAVQYKASDSTSSSAGSSTWYDNVCCWDQTATGQGAGSMPYCELRFPSSPAQLLVSGLLGDVEAVAAISLGTWETSLPTGASLALALGRRGTYGAGAGAKLVGACYTIGAPMVLDSSAYGGYYPAYSSTQTANYRWFAANPTDEQGFYQVVTRAQTSLAGGVLGNLSARVFAAQVVGPVTGSSTVLAAYYGPYVTMPLASSNAWGLVNVGPLWVPLFPIGALTDLTQYGLDVTSQFVDQTDAATAEKGNWQLLLPADGPLLSGSFNNPSNAPGAITNSWVWSYIDQLAMQFGSSPSMWSYGTTTAALPSPSTGAGGAGTAGSGYPNVNPTSDAGLTLDPQLPSSGGAAAECNQLAGYISDGSGDVLAMYGEIAYSPLYLYAR